MQFHCNPPAHLGGNPACEMNRAKLHWSLFIEAKLHWGESEGGQGLPPIFWTMPGRAWPGRAWPPYRKRGDPLAPGPSPPPHPWQASPRGPVPLWQARLARFQTPQAAWPVWPAWITRPASKAGQTSRDLESGMDPGSGIRELRSSDPRSGSGNRGLGSGIRDPGSGIWKATCGSAA